MKKLEELQAPFHPEKIQWRIGATNKDKSKGLALPFIGARTAMDRLDEVMGPSNWERNHRIFRLEEKKDIGQIISDQYNKLNKEDLKELDSNWAKRESTAVICELSLKFNDKWISKADGAGTTDYEQEKGALSDSFKRAAANWGIGRYLYNLDNIWVEVEKRGDSFIPAETPQLPAKALPEDFEQPKSKKKKRRKKTQETKEKNKESTSEESSEINFNAIKGFLDEYEIKKGSLLTWIGKKSGEGESAFDNLEQVKKELGTKWLRPIETQDFWEKNYEEIADEVPF